MPLSVTDICAQFVSLPAGKLHLRHSWSGWDFLRAVLKSDAYLLSYPICPSFPLALQTLTDLNDLWRLSQLTSCSHFYVFIGKFTIKPTVLLFFLVSAFTQVLWCLIWPNLSRMIIELFCTVALNKM